MTEPESEPGAIPGGAATPYADWEPTLAAILESGGTVLILGGVDVGKTTFTRLLANRAAEAGRRIAIVDADLGQSEIGPPGCVGLGFMEKPLAALSDLPPRALAFVGGTSPPGLLLEYAAAIRRLADAAREQLDGPAAAGAETPAAQPRPLLLVDSSGYLHGPSARRFYHSLFDLLRPDHLVGLQRREELEPILRPLRRMEGCRLHAPPIPAVIGPKPPSLRAQRRALRFSAVFRDARLHTYSFEDVSLLGTWLGAGVPVAPHLLKFLNQALHPRAKVYYAESMGTHLGLMVSQPVPHGAPNLGILLEALQAQSLSLTVAPRLKHLLLGLEGGSGKLLGLGLLEALDFRRRTLGVLTPVRAPAAARILRFGVLRLTPEGAQIGALKPGELM